MTSAPQSARGAAPPQHAAMFKRWVLYVGHDARDPQRLCAGSERCMPLVEAIREDVAVQNVNLMLEGGVDIPAWLDGTPILVDTQSREASKGSSAVGRLEELAGLSAPAAPPPQPRGVGEVQGLRPAGERHLQAEDGEGEDQWVDIGGDPGDDEEEGGARGGGDGKLQQSDIDRYIQARNGGGAPR